MEQHPIPRQITTFEFKLVGFLTIKQFIYLIVFIGLGFVMYLIFPIPILNALLGILVAAAGAALAFLPINDRPMDVWIKNLIKRLTSPTQYQFKKNNPPPAFLKDLPTTTTSLATTHVEAQKKLNNYLGTKTPPPTNQKKQTINNLMSNSFAALSGGGAKTQATQTPEKPQPAAVPAQPQAPKTTTPKKPFFTGVIKNHKEVPLYGILVYVKNPQTPTPLRILKTNVNGVFATFNPLPVGDYLFEIKDPNGTYNFDTMKVKIEGSNPHPFSVVSNELI